MEEDFDIKKIIEQGTERTTIEELMKKGIHNIKVLDEETVSGLIKDMVKKILQSKGGFLSEQERQKIYEEARSEFEKVKEEYLAMKTRVISAEDAKTKLSKQLEELHAQLEELKRSQEQKLQKSFQEGAESQKSTIAKLQFEIVELRKKLHQMVSQEELKRSFQEGISSQKPIIERLQKEVELLKTQLEEKTKGTLKLIAEFEKERELLKSEHPREERSINLEDVSKPTDIDLFYSIGSSSAAGIHVNLETNIFELGVKAKEIKFKMEEIEKLLASKS